VEYALANVAGHVVLPDTEQEVTEKKPDVEHGKKGNPAQVFCAKRALVEFRYLFVAEPVLVEHVIEAAALFKNSRVRIEFSLPVRTNIILQIFDITGRLVRQYRYPTIQQSN